MQKNKKSSFFVWAGLECGVVSKLKLPSLHLWGDESCSATRVQEENKDLKMCQYGPFLKFNKVNVNDGH